MPPEPTAAATSLEVRKRRARYRAEHRGTKELDLILGRFAAGFLAQASEAQLGAFEALLEEPDPLIARAIDARIFSGVPAGDETLSAAHADLIGLIRSSLGIEA